LTPTSTPSSSFKPSVYPTIIPSTTPSSSLQPSGHPSLRPSTSSRPSISETPTSSLSSYPSVSDGPSQVPTSSYDIRRQALGPCLGDYRDPLIGAVVNLYKTVNCRGRGSCTYEFFASTITDRDGYYEFTNIPNERYKTEIMYPAECNIGRRQLLKDSSPSLHQNELLNYIIEDEHSHAMNEDKHAYVANGERCEESETNLLDTTYETLRLCCAVEVYWDVDGCVSRSHHHIDHGDSTAPRYYATYIKGQLCGKKLSFDTWETAYHTLEECCEENFYFDSEECLKSKN